jgi:hypothetical protein
LENNGCEGVAVPGTSHGKKLFLLQDLPEKMRAG